MELLVRSGLPEPHLLEDLMAEAGEILPIVAASIKTARASRK